MTERQIAPERYVTGGYQSLGRFISYACQLDCIRSTGARSILLVGVGDGVIPTLLKKDTRIEVTTCDIDPELDPDQVADVRALPFGDGTFDLVCAFQVLEHMPFAESEQALAEMARVSRGAVAISLPQRQTGFTAAFKFPFIRSLCHKDVVSLSLLFPLRFPGFAVSGQHYWEIDWWTVSLGKVRAALRKKFAIQREFTPPLNHYHRFFLLARHEN